MTAQTYHGALQSVLTIAKATVKLACLRWRLSKFEFNNMHRDGMMHQAPDTLSRLNTRGEIHNVPVEEVPVLTITTEFFVVRIRR